MRTHYSRADLGHPCPSCGARVVRAVGFHPACGPEAAQAYARAPRRPS